MKLTNEDGTDYGECVLMFPVWEGTEEELKNKVFSIWKQGYYHLIVEVEKNNFTRFDYDENYKNFNDILDSRMESNYSDVWDQFYGQNCKSIDNALDIYLNS